MKFVLPASERSAWRRAVRRILAFFGESLSGVLPRLSEMEQRGIGDDDRDFGAEPLTQRRTQRVVNLRRVRRVLEGLSECRYRIVDLTQLLKDSPKRIVRFRIIGLRFDGRAER